MKYLILTIQSDQQTMYDCVKRVCGYLGNPGVRGWNKGHNLELMLRKKQMSPGMINNVANFEKTKQLNDRNEATSQIEKGIIAT